MTRADRIHRLTDGTRHPFLKGTDAIVRAHLDIPEEIPIPLTVPHGIDFYHLTLPSDLHAVEPLYLGLNEDFSAAAERHKRVLRFPHPWLMLIHDQPVSPGIGTLFVAPPPCSTAFETMLERIRSGPFERPWGVLVKERGARAEDFDWWESRGFEAHTAGTPTDTRHFHKLRDILSRYATAASPYMSSALIFAASLGRRVAPLPDVPITYAEVGDWEKLFRRESAETARVWRNLISPDPLTARAQAESLLGLQYWASKRELRERLDRAVASTADAPLHLHPLRPGRPVYRLCVALAGAGVPIHRFFPNPIKKLTGRLAAYLRLQRLTVLTGSDFGHYGVAGASVPFTFRRAFAWQSGQLVRPGETSRSEPAVALIDSPPA